jgi:hypothetical protein
MNIMKLKRIRSNGIHIIFSLLAGLGLLFSGITVCFGQTKGPVKVEIRKEGDGYRLYRGGQPHYIKGVGGQVHLDIAQEAGANSIRTWGPSEAINVLDEAERRGMTVVVGLWVGQERQGFDYDDERAVKAQLQNFTEVVKQLKDHPAVLLWGIGNENDYLFTNFKVWYAINDIAKMVHEVDPNHPTMNVTAGLDMAEVQLFKMHTPHIDILGVNTYGDLKNVPKSVRAFGWDGPYIIAEWGPTGHWEVPKTEWGAPIEQTSTEKSEVFRERYEKWIQEDPMCLGSYVFLWGQKQETTQTWYGIFMPDGSRSEVIDVLTYCWSGKWPENRSPHISSFTMQGTADRTAVRVRPGQRVEIHAEVKDPEGNPLRWKWELLPESTDIKAGGDAESKPEEIAFKRISEDNGKMVFRAPIKEGPFRMFFFATDEQGNTAAGNFPFYVELPE